MIANMGKEQNISMSTLARICEALDCQITDVIALAPGDPTIVEGKNDKESNKTDS
ncbi:MAG: helix-turn-helix domain-containing protein [Clostridia bacterium]|nr:helix-turn-helix domain-containing protein [Clostridia bacterium]